MKILFIIPSLLCGGAEKLIVDILNNFNYSAYSVSLLTFYKNEVYGNMIPKQVKRLQPFFIDTKYRCVKRKILGKKLCNIIDLYQLNRVLDKNYDCIISFLEGYSVSIHEKIRCRAKKNITFVHTDISRYPQSLGQFDLSPSLTYSKMDDIVFVSKNSLESFDKTLSGVNTNKLVLRNFIDICNVNKMSEMPLDFQKDCPIIVTVGRIEPVKGFDIIIPLCQQLKKRMQSFKIVIVGGGSCEDSLRNLIHQNGLEDYIIMVGFKKNPYPYMKMSDIFISTSLAEGFPLVICEAMALGKPIIASKTDGASELLGDGTGILVDRDVFQYARSIEELLQNINTYNYFALQSLKKSKEFDKEKYMKSLYDMMIE